MGGSGVGVTAPAVCVCITAASSIANVPTTSTAGVGEACGVHELNARMEAAVKTNRKDGFVVFKTQLPFFSIFAHASFKFTVKLNTGFSDVESLSTQKYPSRSN